jgi:hypothetical protein
MTLPTPTVCLLTISLLVATVENLVALRTSAAAPRRYAVDEHDSGDAPVPHLPGLSAALACAAGEPS